jgi:hypothetical protein
MKIDNCQSKLNYNSLILILLFLSVISSCKSQSKCPPCPGRVSVNPNINFRIIGKDSNNDLFFDHNPQYNFSQIRIQHFINGKADTAYLRIDTVNKLFNVSVNTVHTVDTISLKVANLPSDILLFFTSTEKCCLIKTLNSVTYNGAIVYNANDGAKVVTLAK